MPAQTERRRVGLDDGAATTIHVALHTLSSTRLRVVSLRPAAPLEEWCEEHGVSEAISGGFAAKPDYEPLGELWTAGRPEQHRPSRKPWSDRRAAIATYEERVIIDSRRRMPSQPPRDLLQAGPLLVRDGSITIAGESDPEGFSSTSDEFDEDITADREPRLAIGLTDDAVVAVAADGRSDADAGLTLWELADLLVELGARKALNLDVGSAGVLMAGGRRLNTPRDDKGQDMSPSVQSVSAIVFESDGRVSARSAV